MPIWPTENNSMFLVSHHATNLPSISADYFLNQIYAWELKSKCLVVDMVQYFMFF